MIYDIGSGSGMHGVADFPVQDHLRQEFSFGARQALRTGEHGPVKPVRLIQNHPSVPVAPPSRECRPVASVLQGGQPWE
jgi:hypothetical protein